MLTRPVLSFALSTSPITRPAQGVGVKHPGIRFGDAHAELSSILALSAPQLTTVISQALQTPALGNGKEGTVYAVPSHSHLALRVVRDETGKFPNLHQPLRAIQVEHLPHILNDDSLGIPLVGMVTNNHPLTNRQKLTPQEAFPQISTPHSIRLSILRKLPGKSVAAPYLQSCAEAFYPDPLTHPTRNTIVHQFNRLLPKFDPICPVNANFETWQAFMAACTQGNGLHWFNQLAPRDRQNAQRFLQDCAQGAGIHWFSNGTANRPSSSDLQDFHRDYRRFVAQYLTTIETLAGLPQAAFDRAVKLILLPLRERPFVFDFQHHNNVFFDKKAKLFRFMDFTFIAPNQPHPLLQEDIDRRLKQFTHVLLGLDTEGWCATSIVLDADRQRFNRAALRLSGKIAKAAKQTGNTWNVYQWLQKIV